MITIEPKKQMKKISPTEKLTGSKLSFHSQEFCVSSNIHKAEAGIQASSRSAKAIQRKPILEGLEWGVQVGARTQTGLEPEDRS